MSHVNLHDLSSIERIYPRNAFEHDANRNARGAAAVLYGVKILSAPDSEGAFQLVSASQHVGEGDPEGDTVFLAPQLRGAADALVDGGHYGAAEKGDGLEKVSEQGDDYALFLARLIETARKVTFKSAIGAGEERLRGFHGG